MNNFNKLNIEEAIGKLQDFASFENQNNWITDKKQKWKQIKN